MMNLCFSLYENKFKKKPLPSLSSRKGLTNWRFLLKNNKALCASYFNFQSSIALITMRLLMRNCANKRKKYQPNNFEHCSKPPKSELVSPSPLGRDGRGSLYHLSFFIYHLAKLRFAQSHAACHTKRGCYCGQNRDDQLNNCFPSFFFHKVTNLSPCPPPRGREPAQRAVMQTTLKQATKAAKRFYSRGLLRGIDFKE